MPRPSTGQSNRDLLSSHSGNGKGSADRSPGWRKCYETIDWKGNAEQPDNFQTRGPGRTRKRYGPGVPAKHSDYREGGSAELPTVPPEHCCGNGRCCGV
jgi:hypothetical protein